MVMQHLTKGTSNCLELGLTTSNGTVDERYATVTKNR